MMRRLLWGTMPLTGGGVSRPIRIDHIDAKVSDCGAVAAVPCSVLFLWPYFEFQDALGVLFGITNSRVYRGSQ